MAPKTTDVEQGDAEGSESLDGLPGDRPRRMPGRLGRCARIRHNRDRGRPNRLRLLRNEHGGLQRLVDACERADRRLVLTADVPMGLPDHAGLRACDAAARSVLGRRWPCVFPAPDRELLGHTFEEARPIVRRRLVAEPDRHHPLMTRQSMAIAPKIAEADALLRAAPPRQTWLVEVHPEVGLPAVRWTLW